MHPRSPGGFGGSNHRPDAIWPGKQEFFDQVDFAVALFQINPQLPEIRELKASYDDLAVPHRSSMPPLHYLRRLSPHYTVYIRPDGEVYVAEDPLGSRLLTIGSVIRHHIPNLDEKLEEVVVDNRGLHLYGEPGMSRLATVGGLHIDPHRLADPGNRHQYACRLIAEFTGVELNWQAHVRHTRSIAVTRQNDRWHVKIVPPPTEH